MTISIVLYGRNDNYGYNLHKRAALSLNCMAEVLTDSLDEILFVDYNTPDDFPTFPEAIQDTLTRRARDILRIFRVRPRIHQRFKSKTHLVALEPIARNVAIRRSCPANRWILSTNTDVIFVPRSGNSLSKIAEDLAPCFYHAPRIEIPELLWESLDRHAPADVITTVRAWGSTLHLNEIILGAEFIIYDGPGDFQLLLRDDLFNGHGFHEEMLLGWHVDSNMAKRMYTKYGKIGDLGTEVYGYHCDHTRQVTPAHSHTRLQNDWRRFCHEVDRPDVPEQANTWGCANDTIEEVRLVANPASVYVQALGEALGGPLTEPQLTKYTHETYNRVDYDPRHMVPFLADMFVSMPRSCNAAWYGGGKEMLFRFATVWEKLGFTGRILADPELTRGNDLPELIALDLIPDTINRADAFIFDFGGLPGLPGDIARKRLSDRLVERFLQVVREERQRLSAGEPSRRLIALNTINNQFERLVASFISAAATPCATHMRHGLVLPIQSKDDWLPLVHVGPAGSRVGKQINSERKLGVIAYGPYKYLESGSYRLSIKVELPSDEREHGRNDPCIIIHIQAGAEVFGTFLLSHSALAKPVHEFLFSLPRTDTRVVSDVETRIMSLSHIPLSIEVLTIEAIPTSSTDSTAPIFSTPLAFKIENWLPYLLTGPLGLADDGSIIAQRGPSDFVAYGPYWPLPSGYYEVVILIESHSGTPSLNPLIRADVITGDQQLVAANFHLDAQCASTTLRLPFEMTGSEWQHVETRIWSSGEKSFRIRRLSLEPLEQSGPRDLVPFLLTGDGGQRGHSRINSVDGHSGVIVYTPNFSVKPGYYQVTFAAEVRSSSQAPEERQTCATAFVKCRDEILDLNEIKSTDRPVDERLLFEISNPDYGIEFVFIAICPATVNLLRLTIEPAKGPPQRRCPAALSLRDWLPFLQRGKSAHAGKNGVDVSEGVEEFAVYGPFWTLPPGRYEMHALVVPSPQGGDHRAVVTAQVTAEKGARTLVEGRWRLGQYKLADATPAVEFRLPFSLSGDLVPAARTIETRIFTPGDASFRILSLAVTAKGDEPEPDWFPYLIVGECGVHAGGEIKGIEDKIGYIARTPPMRVVPGRYRVALDMRVEAGVRDEETVAVEAWSGSDLIVVEPMNSGRDKRLKINVTNEFSGNDIELRIRALAPIGFSIRGLRVEKISDAIEPEALPAVLRLNNWLPFLELGAGVRRVGQSVLARYAQSGYVVYGPYWSLPAGDYVMLFAVELDEAEKVVAGAWLRPKSAIKAFLLFAKVLHDGDADVMLDGRQIAQLGGFTIGSFFGRSTSVRLPFEIGLNDVKICSRLETRVWSVGRRGFRIRSLTVRRKMPNERIYKRKNWVLFRLKRAKLVGRMRRLVR